MVLNMYLENIAEAYYWIGTYYKNKKMLDEAIFYFQQLHEDVPDSQYGDDALFEISEVYFKQGRCTWKQ